MQILLVAAYAALLSFIVTRSGFLIRSGLSRGTLTGLFLLYGAVGCAHVVIAFHFFPHHGDVWDIFNHSVALKHQLLHDYPAFKTEFFPDKFYIDITGTHNGWSYYEQQWLTALELGFNFISFDNIYVNTLLFCLLTMFGKIALYRMMAERYPQRHVVALGLSFLIPSVVFWTSVINKEGLLFCCLGLLLFCLQRVLKPGPTSMRRLGFLLPATLMLLIIFITRKAIVLTLVPGIIIWVLAERTRIRLRYIVAGVFSTFIAGLILAASAGNSWNLLYQISGRQHEFFNLKGGSEIYLPALEDNALSFLRAAPYAIYNGLLMVQAGRGGRPVYLLFAAELIVIWLTVVRSLVKKRSRWDGLTCGMLIFALGGSVIIGYTVPFAGAIIRYRSLFYPFLLAPFLLSVKSNEDKLNLF